MTATGQIYMCEFKPEGPPGQVGDEADGYGSELEVTLLQECEATWSRSFLPEEVQSQSELGEGTVKEVVGN